MSSIARPCMLVLVTTLAASCERRASLLVGLPWKTKDGIRIDGALQPDVADMKALVNMELWKLGVTLPKDAPRVDFLVEIRRKGEKPEEVLKLILHPKFTGRKGNVLAGVYPPDGKSIRESEKLKFFMRFRGAGGATAAANKIVDNPFKAARHMGWGSMPDPQPEGDSLLLMAANEKQGGGISSRASENDISLVLVAKTVEAEGQD